MDLSTIKTSLKNGIDKTSAECEIWLLENGYIYNKTFGWEKKELIEQFNLDPNMSGVPMQLKPLWVEKKASDFKDSYGNKVKADGGRTEWVKHPTKTEWYPSDSWLIFYKYTTERDKKTVAQKTIPLPVE